MKRGLTFLVLFVILTAATPRSAFAGLLFVRSNGISLTNADGVTFAYPAGITLTGADGILRYSTNGIILTGADGVPLTAANATITHPGGVVYTGSNGISLTGADGISLTGADGISLNGADGVTLTGADGTRCTANTIIIRKPNGITLTGADGVSLAGTSGILPFKTDGITLTGADGITLTGADEILLAGADSVTGFGPSGLLFDLKSPSGITLTGADGISLTGADGITLTGADGITLTGADAGMDGMNDPAGEAAGIQSLDPELALILNNATDDSSINAVVVFHHAVTDADLAQLVQIGILGGTRFRRLPMVYVSGTRDQIIAISHLPSVRSIFGNRTLQFNADPYFTATGIERAAADSDLKAKNAGLPFTGRGVTVAVIDTGINGTHPDLAGKLAQNVHLVDLQSLPAGFTYPAPLEDMANTDLVNGHGTFVGGIIAGSGSASNGKYSGVAPGARLLGLGAGELNLTHVLSGFDYILDRGGKYNTRIVNCSFSSNSVFDLNDPVNVATRQLTNEGINVIFSAGNTGPGNGSLNPYAAAPWVIGVGATDQNSRLADFSSRGNFGDEFGHPSVAAPGVNVVSLRNIGTITGTAGIAAADAERLSPAELPFYTTASGTSFSAPQVAAAVALMLEANPSLTPAEIKDIICRTATPLPSYFYHEAGAGMLNLHAALLEAAFPERRGGTFRAMFAGNSLRFLTSAQPVFTARVIPGTEANKDLTLPMDTVQASVTVLWGPGTNDFGLSLFGADGTLLGESNYLNLPLITGRSENVSLRLPAPGNYRAAAYHTGGIGTVQDVFGIIEVTQAEFPDLSDLSQLSSIDQRQAKLSLLRNVMMPAGKRYRPYFAVRRVELAQTLLRAGFAPQYIAASSLFPDVHSVDERLAVESIQTAASGPMIFDAKPGKQFFPDDPATKLIAAVAYVKAAGLEQLAETTPLPLAVEDAALIPASLRGYVAVALKYGFIGLDGNRFAPSRSITRIELAKSVNAILARIITQ